MLAHVQKAITRRRMIEPGDHVVAAVSGGADSVCMLDMLDRLRDMLGFSLEVAHFEHGIRGQDSRGDAEFVEKLARSKGLEFFMEAGDVPSVAREKKLSMEEAAREERYAFFRRILAARRANTRIALGHTATDQAETVLMRLIRGAGVRGLSGIPPVRGPYIRPLIEVEREAVLKYLENRGLDWREDATNLSAGHLRNRIRRELMPAIARGYNPRIVEVLSRTSEVCRLTADFMDAVGEEAFRGKISRRGRGFFLPGEVFVKNHPAVGLAAFEKMWEMARGGLKKLRNEHRSAVVEAAREGRSGIYCMPDGWTVAVDSGGVWLSPHPPVTHVTYRIPLEIPGRTCVEQTGAEIESEVMDRPSEDKWKNASSREAYLDMEKVSGPVEVRPPGPGDRMRPLGGKGSRKLQDIYTDLKAPRWIRPLLPVVTAGGEIAWAPPFRIGHEFRITEDTRKVLHLRLAGLDFHLSNDGDYDNI